MDEIALFESFLYRNRIGRSIHLEGRSRNTKSSNLRRQQLWLEHELRCWWRYETQQPRQRHLETLQAK